jgi:hypothetical protein
LPVVNLSLNTSSASAAAGQSFSYTWDVVVTGGAPQNAVLTQSLPPGVTVTGFPQGPSGVVSGSQITWTLGNLPVGTTQLQVNVVINPSIAGGTILASQGGLVYNGGSASSNSASVTVVASTLTPTLTPFISFTPTPGTSNGGGSGTGQPILFPNPVTGDGPVSIRLPNYRGAATVTLQVFTTAFRMVNTLSYPNQVGGVDVALPLSDRHGVPLANGLYYVLVTTPDGKSILKLLVLR